MKAKRFFTIALFLALFLFFLSAISGWTQASKYKLQPSDILTITVHNHPDLTTKTRVSTDGYITFPLLGKVIVKDFTVQELEGELKRLLERDYLVSAQVVVFIEEYHPRQVSVLGEVKLPGKFDMPQEKDMTLLDAIAMAEGFTKDALEKRVKVIRTKEDGTKNTIVINVIDITHRDKEEKNIILEPGDIIVVPESFF
ncbi:MAG: polysaccharide export protein [Candidatus Omnitrophota bacterium]|nr:MAG: polysaccharide export protein [Candidatus Omnitrophota bacterium]